MHYKLTIDINLMNEDPNIPSMDTLKRWTAEGKIQLIEAEAPKIVNEANDNSPAVQPRTSDQRRDPRSPGGRRVIKREPSGGANFRGVAAVLFPQRDSQKLHMGEINDVVHILQHHSSKNELFVTHNLKDFIENGKRERLKAAFGIIAMTPDEAVEMLSTIEGWK